MCKYEYYAHNCVSPSVIDYKGTEFSGEYYVYIWKVDNCVFYVGMGKGDRFKSLGSRNERFRNIVSRKWAFCTPEIIYMNMSKTMAREMELKTIAEYSEKSSYLCNREGNEHIKEFQYPI